MCHNVTHFITRSIDDTRTPCKRDLYCAIFLLLGRRQRQNTYGRVSIYRSQACSLQSYTWSSHLIHHTQLSLRLEEHRTYEINPVYNAWKKPGTSQVSKCSEGNNNCNLLSDTSIMLHGLGARTLIPQSVSLDMGHGRKNKGTWEKE